MNSWINNPQQIKQQLLQEIIGAMNSFHSKQQELAHQAQIEQMKTFFRLQAEHQSAFTQKATNQSEALSETKQDKTEVKINKNSSQAEILKKEVQDTLIDAGYSFDSKVCFAGLIVDFVIKCPQSNAYVIALSINQNDSFVAYKEAVNKQGLKYYDVDGSEWFPNKLVAQQQLRDEIDNALKHYQQKVEQMRAQELAAKEKLKQTLLVKSQVAKSETPTQETISPSSLVKTESKTQVRRQRLSVGFDEPKSTKELDNADYIALDLKELSKQYSLPFGFMQLLTHVLKVEAPLSEEFFLKRFVWYFDGRQKVTEVVKSQFEVLMKDHKKYGIVRKNKFMYLSKGSAIKFRKVGNSEREVKYIAPEELADGLVLVLKTKGIGYDRSMNKVALYQELGKMCGVYRIGGDIRASFDEALKCAQDRLTVRGEKVILKN